MRLRKELMVRMEVNFKMKSKMVQTGYNEDV